MPQIPVVNVKPGYTPQSSDTSIEADVLMFQLWRQLTPQQRVQRAIAFNQAVRELVISGIQHQYPQATTALIRRELIKRRFGEKWVARLESSIIQHNVPEIVIANPIALARKIAEILESLDIPYMVGGSVASSLFGENRATEDLDLVLSISLPQAQQLIARMEKEFYISETAVNEAVVYHQSFNVIDLASMEKADIFVLKDDDPFFQSKIHRRRLYEGIYIYSPEDIVLQKLVWYQLSNQESQKQWRDILGVLKAQGEALDWGYLNHWAEVLRVTESFQRALQQAGLEAG